MFDHEFPSRDRCTMNPLSFEALSRNNRRIDVRDSGVAVRLDGAAGAVMIGAAASCWSVLNAFNRPPVATLPVSDGFASTPDRMAERTCAYVAVGRYANASAAVPETCGVAIDVPLR